MRNRKRKNKIILLLIVLCTLALGYSLITSTLNINGTAGINKNTWNIHWDRTSVEVNNKSTTTNLPTISEDNMTVSYSTILQKPGDFYEFTIDAVNEGTIDGMISIDSLTPVIKNELLETIDLPKYLKYTVTYSDGVQIEKNHLLKKQTSEKYKIRLEFDKEVEAEDLPENPEAITIETEVPYTQPDENGYEREHNTTYTINFDANGGSVSPTSKTINIGENIGALPTPTKENCIFDGWYTDISGGTKITTNTIPEENVTYYAHWISSIDNVIISPSTISLNVGEEETIRISGPQPIESYTFTSNNQEVATVDQDGKVTGISEGTTTITITGTTSHKTRTIEVTITQQKYTITFDANGGEVTPTSKTINAGTQIGDLPTPTRENYIFDGWYTDSEAGTKIETTTIPTGNDTYYAHWIENNKYTITFDANGGEVSPTSKEIVKGSQIGELPVPTRERYTFDGWHISLTNGIEVDESYIPEEDTILYAYWYPSSKVAAIGTTYYDTLQLAVDAVPTTGEETTIRLLKDTSEVITISSGKNAVFNLNTHTLSNSGNNNVIKNSGRLKIISGTITSDEANGAINNNSGATLIMTGGRVVATGTRQGIYNDGGTLTITGTAEVTASTNQRAAVHNKNSGTVYITGGTVTSTGAYAVYNESGTINIGTKDGNVDKTSPIIKGQTYGIVANSKYNFYDGTIKGITNSVGTATTGNTPTVAIDTNESKINEIEENSEKVKSEEAINNQTYKILYLHQTNIITVTFDANQGTVDEPTRAIETGNEIGALPIPTRRGYIFNGWYTDKTTGERVTSSYTPEDDVTIYARWEEKTNYTVVLDPNGGSVTPDEIDVIPNESVGELPTPTREGYKFLGWYTEISGGTQVTSSYIPQTKISTIYARWNNFPTVFKQEGACEFNGSGTITGSECTKYINKTYIDTGIALYSNENYQKDYEIGFTIESYIPSENTNQATFVNAKLESSSDGYPGLVYRRVNSTDSLEITQTIAGTKASKNTEYTNVTSVRILRIDGIIYYSYNDGELQELQDTSGFNNQFDLSTWFGASPLNAAGTSAQRYLNATLSNMYIKLGTYEEEGNNLVTFNPNGGSVSQRTKKVREGQQLGNMPIPTRENYIFLGWYTEVNGGTQVTTSYIPTSNITLYAQWQENPKYLVTFNPNGGSVSPDTKSVYEGTEIGNLPIPTREEYTFLGWYTEVNGGTQVTTSYVPTSNITLYAHWQGNIILEYNANGGVFTNNESINTNTYRYSSINETRYSHTPNIDDNGSATSTYDDGLDINDIVTIEGADQLTIEVWFTTESESYDWLAIYPKGVTPTYDNYELATISGGKLAGYGNYEGYTKPSNNDTEYHKTFIVDGDTAQFYFRSDSSVNYYGYYAKITANTQKYKTSDEYIEPTREDHLFTGWNTLPDGTGSTYTTKEQIEETIKSLNQGITLYAQWHQLENYTITFNPNGGEVTPTSKTVKEFQAIGELPTPTKTNASFTGWYTGLTTGEQIDETFIPTSDTTLYAHWLGDVNINYDSTTGIFENNNQTKSVNYKYETAEITKYSHTPNIDDTGKASSVYSNNLSITDVVTIPGASTLEIEVWFSTESASYDWLAIYPTGVAPASGNASLATISGGKLAGHGSYSGYTKPADDDTVYHRTFIVDGDTAQFFFRSDSSSNYYGYYAIIKGTGKTYTSKGNYEVPTKNRHIFVGWNTKEDGTGDSYINETAITNDVNIINGLDNKTLYAQWIEATATFDTGSNVNAKMKRLSGSTSATYSTSNSNITAVERVDELPDMEFTSDNIVSTSNSLAPIYMWFDSGTIKWYTNSDTIYLNENSSYMFSNLTRVTSIDISDVNTSNTTNMGYMFNNCAYLETIDLSNFDTSNVTKMSYMFYYNTKLTSLNLENFNTQKVQYMDYMFYHCTGLTNLGVEDFDTSNVTTMSYMFAESSNITTLDLSKWNTSKLTNTSYMFYSCSKLQTIYASELFDTSKLTTSSSHYMFYSSSKLVGGNGTVYNYNHSDKEYAHIDGGTSNPGYFTTKTGVVVTYDGQSEKFANFSKVINENTPIGDLPEVEKEGYTFIDWFDAPEGGNVVNSTTIPEGNTTYYAQWSINSYTVTFDSQGGSEVPSITKEYNSEIGELPTPTKNNYMFIGWYEDNENYERRITPTTLIKKDITYYAKWVMPTDYNLTFDANGGSFADSTTSNEVTYKIIELGEKKVSHTPNISDDGTQNGNYAAYTKQIDTVTIENATRIHVKMKYDIKYYSSYSGYSTTYYYDHLYIYKGIYEGTTSDFANYNYLHHYYGLNQDKEVEFDVEGDTVSFGFNGTQKYGGYGYYAEVTGYAIYSKEGEYKESSIENKAFIGWNDQADGSGNTYLDDIDVAKKIGEGSGLTLYAQYAELPATFDTGQIVNKKLKVLAGEDCTTYGSYDRKITSIIRSNEKPVASYMFSYNIISAPTSAVPIYAWFDEGTIYWWTEDPNPKLNEDASYMFYRFEVLSSLDVNNIDSSQTKNLNHTFDIYDSESTAKIEYLDLSGWNTSNVEEHTNAFSGIKKLNISGWDLRNSKYEKENTYSSSVFGRNTTYQEVIARNIKFNDYSIKMFRYSNINSLDLSNGDATGVTSTSKMFDSCFYLNTLIMTDFNASTVTDMSYMFYIDDNYYYRIKLKNLDLSGWDTSSAEDMSYMFSKLYTLESVSFTGWDTSKVKNMSHMFDTYYSDNYYSRLNTIDMSSFNTSNVEDMSYMFHRCGKLESIDISNFNTGKVTNMSHMFQMGTGRYESNTLKSINFGSINTSNVEDMSYMFYDCDHLTSLNVTMFNTTSVKTMERMFYGCATLTELNVNNFNTSNVENMSGMFASCSKITSLDLTSFNTASVTNMSSMFAKCTSITSINLSSFNTNNVENMSSMFANCSSLPILNVTNFNTSKVKDMSSMFSGCSSLPTINVTNFNTESVTTMASMFASCSSFKTIDLSSFDTRNVTTMASMFSGCSKITNLDVSMLNTEKVTNMSSMFSSCSSLINLDLSTFDTKRVTNMNSMFSSCSNILSINMNNWDTSNLTTATYMFAYCTNLPSIDVTGFNTEKLNGVEGMFHGSSSLSVLDLSTWDTSSFGNMGGTSRYTVVIVSGSWTYGTFQTCRDLTTIYVGEKFDLTGKTAGADLFYESTKLVGGAGTKYDSTKTSIAYAKVDGGPDDPGYFTMKNGWILVNRGSLGEPSEHLLEQQWSYYENAERVESGFRILNDLYGQPQKYFFVNGRAHMGWLKYEGDYYYLSTSDDDGNGYVNCGAYRSSSPETTVVVEIDGRNYEFDNEGRCINYEGQAFNTVTFNANGGTIEIDTRNINTNSQIGDLPIPTKDNYIFDGWYTSPTDGTIVDSTYVPNGNITLYARWHQKDRYKITFNANGGTTNEPIRQVIESNSIGELPTPTRENHLFAGWFTGLTDGTPVDSTFVPTEDTVLYAHWGEYYPVTYNYNREEYSFALGEYVDTGYTIDWDRNFTLTSKVNIPELGKRYLIFGNYNGTNKDLGVEIKANNTIRVWLNGSERSASSGKVVANTDLDFIFTWDSNTKTYTFTVTGEGVDTTTTGTHNVTGLSQKTLRFGTADQRSGTNPYQPLTVKSAKITYNEVSGAPLSSLPQAIDSTSENKSFNGWYTELTGGTAVTTETIAPAESVEYYGHWN